MGNTISIGVGVDANQAIAELNKLEGKVDDVGKTASKTHDSPGFKGVILGAGIAAGMAAWNLMGDAVGAVINKLQEGIQGAIDEETQLARLDGAIRANATAWDGNMAAIEDVIASRVRLGFSDEDQRESLAKLVASTKDVDEALEVQRVAMDLARLKGIELASASDIVARAMLGEGRGLRDLGIDLKGVTDKTQILGKIQDAAAGQAEAYGETTAGALSSMNAAVDEVFEAIGTELLPVIKSMAEFIRDDAVPAITSMGAGLDYLGWANQKAEETGIPLAMLWSRIPAIGDEMGTSIADYNAYLKEQADLSAAAAYQMSIYERDGRLVSQVLKDVSESTDTATTKTKEFKDELPKLQQEIRDTARTARDNLLDEAWELKQLPVKISLAKIEVAQAMKELEAAKTTEQKRAAELRLLQAQQELEGLLLKLKDSREDAAAEGGRFGNAIGEGLYDGVRYWTRRAQTEIANVISAGQIASGSGRQIIEPRAAGGPVFEGLAYVVGEQGPELFVPRSTGTILPTAANSLTLSAGAIVVNGAGDPEAVARSIMLALKRETTRQGMTL